MSSTSPPTSRTRRRRRATSGADRPKRDGADSTARTLSTRSARSSASAPRQASRSARAEASSGPEEEEGPVVVVVVRLRMRSPEDYVRHLLDFATTSDTFQILCGGVHILDFFTNEPGLFNTCVPQDWQPWLAQCDPMKLLDILMRDDLDSLSDQLPPDSLVKYVRDVRRLSLAREFSSDERKLPKLTRQTSVGMKPKKIHEVRNFASYVDRLANDMAAESQGEITHFVDFGSGQNYLGRALASAPYNKQVIAVEGREHNIVGAKDLDMLAGISEKPKIMRNKKLWMQQLDNAVPEAQRDKKALKRAAKSLKAPGDYMADMTPRREHEAVYEPEEGKGFIRYIEGRLESGDLTDVVGQLEEAPMIENEGQRDLRLMAISIHSCGNLSHHGVRSLILNPRVQAVAIVGCCYNLMTERLGPPTYKHPYLRPSMQALNGRVVRESARRDPQGFPMSDRLCAHGGDGVRLNITARMMACQAPQNWSDAESDAFFTRHFFRAVLQKIFLDRGVITRVYHDGGGGGAGGPRPPDGAEDDGARRPSPFNTSTNPVIIGSLPKSCYRSLGAYVRGAVAKLTTHSEFRERHGDVVGARMGGMSDAEIAGYEAAYGPRRRELSSIWSLMAFSAVVVESLIVTDRWLFLRQHADAVRHCWVETVFDHRESPRNLVVVGIKQPVS
ncbi:methyltransferase domain-containing protein [Xylariaceae sp. FL0804]|nr:methyltransferase domain-containing protein [Xylariaceae sp. FL0804]